MKKRNSITNYRSKNNTAVNMVRSWLKVAGIEFAAGAGDVDLYISKKTGGKLSVAILADGASAPVGTLCVKAKDITGRSPRKYLEAWHAVTEAAGYGRPAAVKRGRWGAGGDAVVINPVTGNPRKLSYANEPFMVALRHTEFCRSPNPDPKAFERYKRIYERAAWSFFRRPSCVDLCRRSMLDIDDLKQMAMLWTVTFVGRYEVSEEKLQLKDENEKLLTLYLTQRFSEMFVIYSKKERSELPDADTASIALYSKPAFNGQFQLNSHKTWKHNDKDAQSAIDELTSHDPRDDHFGLQVTQTQKSSKVTVEARKSAASDSLTKLLSELPHDEMIARLVEVAENGCTTEFGFKFLHGFFDPGAVREARRHLTVHKATCMECEHLVVLPVEEDEESTGVDSGSATE